MGQGHVVVEAEVLGHGDLGGPAARVAVPHEHLPVGGLGRDARDQLGPVVGQVRQPGLGAHKHALHHPSNGFPAGQPVERHVCVRVASTHGQGREKGR